MAIDIVLRVDEKKGIVAVENFGKRTKNSLRNTEKQGTKSMNRLATNGTKALKTLAVAFVGTFAVTRLVQGLRSAVAATAEFQKGIAEIKTLGIEKPINEITKDVSALTREFGQAPQATIKAYYDAISAGIKEANIGKFMKEASRLAIAGATDVSTATDLLTTLSNVFRDKTTRQLAAYANEAKNLGKLTIPELAQNLGTVAATAKTAGASVQELFAATVSLTKQGIETQTAMTGLRAMFSSIVSPGGEVAKAAEKAGIEFSITALRAKGLAGFLTELVPKLAGNDKLITQLFGNVRAFNAVAAITNDNARDFSEALEKISDEVALEHLEQGFKTMTETASFSFATLREEIGSLGREITGQFLPSLAATARSTRDLFKTNRTEIVDTVSIIGQAIGKIGSVIALFVQGAVGGFSALFSFIPPGIAKVMEGFIFMVDGILQLIRFLVSEASIILNKIPGVEIDVSGALRAMDNFRTAIADDLEVATAALNGMGETARFVASAQFQGIRDSVDNIFEPFKTSVGEAAEETEKLAKVVGEVVGDDASAAAAKQTQALDDMLVVMDAMAALLPSVIGAPAFKPGEEMLIRMREELRGAKDELADLGAAFQLTEDPAEQGLLARQILAGLTPELVGPEIAERLQAIFGEMDLEELREHIPSLIDLMRSEDPAEDAKKIADNLAEPIGLSIESLQTGLQGAANIFSSVVQQFGQASKIGAAFAKAQAISQSIRSIIEGHQAVFGGGVKVATAIYPPNPPQAASGFAMKVAGIAQIAGGVAGIARAAGIGAAQKGGLFEAPALSTFAERGPELALPLEDERTTAALAEAFGKAAEEGAPGGGPTVIVNGVFATEDQTYRAVARGLREARDVDVGVT